MSSTTSTDSQLSLYKFVHGWLERILDIPASQYCTDSTAFTLSCLFSEIEGRLRVPGLYQSGYPVHTVDAWRIDGPSAALPTTGVAPGTAVPPPFAGRGETCAPPDARQIRPPLSSTVQEM